MKYRAFLSYSHRDKATVRKLHKRLESFSFTLPLEKGRRKRIRLRPIFLDREDLAAAGALSDTVMDAMAQSEFLIVCCSPASAESKWVNREIACFREKRGSKHILAAILSGDPDGLDRKQCFPEELRKVEEPLAADLRSCGDGWSRGLCKLAAALTSVDLDQVIRRQRRQTVERWIWRFASISIMVPAVISVGLYSIALSIVGNNQSMWDSRRFWKEFRTGDLATAIRIADHEYDEYRNEFISTSLNPMILPQEKDRKLAELLGEDPGRWRILWITLRQLWALQYLNVNSARLVQSEVLPSEGFLRDHFLMQHYYISRDAGISYETEERVSTCLALEGLAARISQTGDVPLADFCYQLLDLMWKSLPIAYEKNKVSLQSQRREAKGD